MPKPSHDVIRSGEDSDSEEDGLFLDLTVTDDLSLQPCQVRVDGPWADARTS